MPEIIQARVVINIAMRKAKDGDAFAISFSSPSEEHLASIGYLFNDRSISSTLHVTVSLPSQNLSIGLVSSSTTSTTIISPDISSNVI